MKKLFIFITCLFLINLMGVGVLAQDTELPKPGLTPDSPFYFLERIIEEIGTFFTFGDLKKASRYSVLASERMAEAEAMAKKEKTKIVQKTIKRYEVQLNKALEKAELAKNKGKSIKEINKNTIQNTARHLAGLDVILEQMPEQLKQEIINAREISKKWHKQVLKNLAEEDEEEAIKINLKVAEKRLERAQERAEAKELEEVERAVNEFKEFSKFGEEISEIAKQINGDASKVEELVGKATSVHLEILANVYEKVPEKAKESIEKAMEVSVRGHERAVEVIRKSLEKKPKDLEEALEKISEEVLIPEEIPINVKQRIRENVREEIEQDKSKNKN